jgi:hypothetical protein
MMLKNILKTIWMFTIYGMSPAIPPGKMCRVGVPYNGNTYEFDLYEPEECRYGTWLLATGLTLPGEKDKRITGLAEAMRRMGLRVAALAFPGLKSINMNLADIDAIKAAIKYLYGTYSSPIGIHGYCIGGGYALAAASSPELSGMVDSFVLVGPHYDISQAWANLYDVYMVPPKNERDWDCFLWMNLILAYRHRDKLDFCKADKAELEYLCWTYCNDKSLVRKKRFYDKCLKGIDFAKIEDIVPEKTIADQLSPAGKLKNLPSKVFILHDIHDVEVRPGQADKLFDELNEREPRTVQQMHVSSVLSHAEITNLANPKDIYQTVWMFSKLFSIRQDRP